MGTKPYVVIGRGFTGNAVAKEICTRKYGPVIMLEKEEELGMHASGRNSGVLHSGINLKPGSIKSAMCIEGNRLAREYCKAHNVPMQECGTLVVVRENLEDKLLQQELDRFDQLERRCKEAGIAVRILTKKELQEREPYVKGQKALLSPNGAIVDSKKFLESIAQDAISLGAKPVNARVYDIKGSTVLTTNGNFEAYHIINAAGLYADKIAHMMGIGLEFETIPFRGEYFKMNAGINSMVYTPPNFDYPFLDIHLTKTTDGAVIAGPNAVLSFGRESYNKEINWKETIGMLSSPNFWGMVSSKEFLKLAYENFTTSFSRKAFLKEIRTLMPDVEEEDILPYRSGIRAQQVDRKGRIIDDIVVIKGENSTHILNVVSPGMTCSLSFGKYIVDQLPCP